MIKVYPKIFALGHKSIQNIFVGEVEVTEKIDGSQFNFGKYKGQLLIRSKGVFIDPDSPDKMFYEGVEYVKSIQHLIPDNNFSHCEYLKKLKHNVLSYNRIPKNHLIMFGMSHTDESFYPYDNFNLWANKFGIETVPILFKGNINNIEELFSNDILRNSTKGFPEYYKKYLLKGAFDIDE